jgi:hypothetical protein
MHHQPCRGDRASPDMKPCTAPARANPQCASGVVPHKISAVQFYSFARVAYMPRHADIWLLNRGFARKRVTDGRSAPGFGSGAASERRLRPECPLTPSGTRTIGMRIGTRCATAGCLRPRPPAGRASAQAALRGGARHHDVSRDPNWRTQR